MSRAGQLQRGLGGGEVDGGWWKTSSRMGVRTIVSKQQAASKVVTVLFN